MITFRYVRWKNLLSTGNYFTEIKLDNNTNTLVVGENGSGKSTMLDALCFGLFGKAFRNVNKPNLLNSINSKDCIVEVEFNTNNKSYKIVRGIKPNKFEIYCDGELVNQDAAARDYQEYLEKFILKLNYKSFTQIVILGSASFVPFMQLSASDRRAIIEDLLDIQIFSTMNGLLKDRLTNNKDVMAQSKSEIELTQQRYDLQDKHIKGLKQNNENKVTEYVSEIRINTSTIQTLHAEIANLSSQVETHQNLVAEKTLVEDKVKKITKLESQIESNLSKFRKDISFFAHNDDCPTCRQAIATEFKETELQTLQTKASECEHGLTQLEIKLLAEQSKLNEITEIQKRIQSLQIEIATKNTSITETNKYITKLEKLIEELKTNKASTEKEEEELKTLNDTLTELKSNLRHLIDEKSYYEVASGLLKDTGIKTKIIKQYLPIINKLVNKYLASLDFFVNFNLDESFKETIKSRHRDDFTYNNFSEGEKSKINLALLFTWRAVAKLKNSSNTNLLILDEIIDSALDHNAIDNFLSLINNMDDNTSVFVISPKGDIYNDKFNDLIRFQKNSNFSHIIK
jgi:DNA repair exonuclease SbcCD ATPase subunit